MAALYGRAAIDNLHDRVGEEEQLRGMPHSGDRDTTNGAWARGLYWNGHHDGGSLGVYSDQGPTFDYEMEALEAGLDIYRHEDDQGRRDHAGAYFALGRVDGSVTHITGQFAGSDRVDAVSLGGYWTHFWANGAYLDGVAQYSWYDVEALSPRLAPLKARGEGVALSVEGALPLHVAAGWVLEPQAQVTFQTFDKTSANDIGGQVTFDNTDSLIGRLGLRAARTWTREDDQHHALLTTGWLRLNVDHQFLDQPKTTFATDDGPVVFQANLGAYWAELGGGFTHQMSQDAALFGSAGYQKTFDGDTHAWTLKLGMRFNW
jgi:outer membrane autotransporter protein